MLWCLIPALLLALFLLYVFLTAPARRGRALPLAAPLRPSRPARQRRLGKQPRGLRARLRGGRGHRTGRAPQRRRRSGRLSRRHARAPLRAQGARGRADACAVARPLPARRQPHPHAGRSPRVCLWPRSPAGRGQKRPRPDAPLRPNARATALVQRPLGGRILRPARRALFSPPRPGSPARPAGQPAGRIPRRGAACGRAGAFASACELPLPPGFHRL